MSYKIYITVDGKKLYTGKKHDKFNSAMIEASEYYQEYSIVYEIEEVQDVNS